MTSGQLCAFDLAQSGFPKLRYADFEGTRAMTKEYCRTNALECYRVAQKAGDPCRMAGYAGAD